MSTGYYVFCLDDLQPYGSDRTYVPATRTVFPEIVDARTYADTIADSRKPIVIQRDLVTELVKKERHDFADRWKTLSVDGQRKLFAANDPMVATCLITPPKGLPYSVPWIEFRSSVKGVVSEHDLLGASYDLLRKSEAEVKTPTGVYKIVLLKPEG